MPWVDVRMIGNRAIAQHTTQTPLSVNSPYPAQSGKD